jgi:hypothetical protein
MLSFTLAVAVYSSMIASAWPLVHRDDWEFGRAAIWPTCTTIPTAWCLLWWLYRRWRLPHALRVHRTGPVIALWLIAAGLCFGVFAAVACLADLPPESPTAIANGAVEGMAVAVFVMLYACGISAAVSLPCATLMLLYLTVQPAGPSQPERRPTSSQLLGHGRQ